MKKLLAVFILLFSINCSAQKKFSLNNVSSHTAPELKKVIDSYGLSAVSARLKFGIDVYVLNYKTLHKSDSIMVSGLLCLPKTKTDLPLISFQHGTIFNNAEAPTINPIKYKEIYLLASEGYPVFIPDYIGYGNSVDQVHPYYHKVLSAHTVIDGILTALTILNRQNKDVILLGYSEGGYVSLATHEIIEKDFTEKINVRLLAAGAGGYLLKDVMNEVALNAISYPYPAYLAFIIYSYNNVYEWNKPLAYYFNKTYADKLPSYMDKKHYGSSVNTFLTANISNLFNESFLKRLKAGSDTLLTPKLSANSIVPYNTESLVRLYHGTKDEIIPIQTTITVHDSFKSKGVNVSLIKLDGASHSTGFYQMLFDFYNLLPEIQK